MPIEFNCEYCRQLIRVPTESAGQQARCPFCRNVQAIPASSVDGPISGSPEQHAAEDQANSGTESPYLNPSFDELAPVTPPTPPSSTPPPTSPPSPPTAFPASTDSAATSTPSPAGSPPPTPPTPGSTATPNPYREPPQNPYGATSQYATADVTQQLNLATVGDRFLGVVIDYLFSLICAIPGVAVAIIADSSGSQLMEQIAALLLLVGILANVGTQWTLITTRAQSIGKIIMKTRIVTQSGAAPGFLHGVVLRIWLFGLISLPFSCLCGPGVLILTIIDGLMVLGERRQCLHDMLASTFVISDRELTTDENPFGSSS